MAVVLRFFFFIGSTYFIYGHACGNGARLAAIRHKIEQLIPFVVVEAAYIFLTPRCWLAGAEARWIRSECMISSLVGFAFVACLVGSSGFSCAQVSSLLCAMTNILRRWWYFLKRQSPQTSTDSGQHIICTYNDNRIHKYKIVILLYTSFPRMCSHSLTCTNTYRALKQHDENHATATWNFHFNWILPYSVLFFVVAVVLYECQRRLALARVRVAFDYSRWPLCAIRHSPFLVA